ncbi:1-aminocyclopropane-1-carboxylate deaminase/D-cysteine desulfhydrase [uncultured Eudoraea sp.]|uniref:1-aminocyclopropane-1-carboxylate deaminase/D-cysteine desulfhydrase n=1 Tax=uncultured Eudoraea sp. TaxID=1035614 RepID=UPI00261276C1|nr:pyridoxal-phosphate dependent enzyme [uncultured Eudoraea sp.]
MERLSPEVVLVTNQKISLPLLEKKNVALYIKREDLIHPQISGNKYRKLKYNLLKAKELKYDTLLTFGGAYSNHIAATAYAGKLNKMRTIGVIRGEEVADLWTSNPTLSAADKQGMKFKFVSRTDYRKKETAEFLSRLKTEFGDFYMVPEGGTNQLAVKGCEEILTSRDAVYDVICCSVGTGGTLAGIINSATPNQQVLGFPALKGDFLKKDICKFVENGNWDLCSDYHFGGYARVDESLISFINEMNENTGIPFDPVYTGKMMYGILDMIAKDKFKPGTKILAIHTGGLQGIAGINLYLKSKNLPLIDL